MIILFFWTDIWDSCQCSQSKPGGVWAEARSESYSLHHIVNIGWVPHFSFSLLIYYNIITYFSRIYINSTSHFSNVIRHHFLTSRFTKNLYCGDQILIKLTFARQLNFMQDCHCLEPRNIWEWRKGFLFKWCYLRLGIFYICSEEANICSVAFTAIQPQNEC